MMPRTLATRLRNTFPVRAYLAAGFWLALFCVVSGLQVSGSKASAASSGGGGAQKPTRTLSLEERVRYQRAVEEVYWQHTIWPKENAATKPRLDEVASLEVTRARVEDVLRKSDALERQWKRPVTAAQLQSEVARMARETRQPEVLRELWQALDNDPLVVAEVLARPVLVERLMRNYYSSDEGFHGALRAKVEAQLREHATLDALQRAGGKFSQFEAVKVARKSSRAVSSVEALTAAATKGAALELTADEWEAETARLKAMFGAESCATCGGGVDASSLPVGGVSSLQEDEGSFYVTSVVSASTGKRLRVARVEWAKTSFDSWWSGARAGFKPDAATEGFDYQLAEINGAAATDDTWTPTKALPEATGTAVWTGTEMIVWGGGKQNSGARYNPATDTWTPTSATNVPSHRSGHTAVWTGTEMIVWGGCERFFSFCGTNTGGRYNPVSDTWTATSVVNAPTPRSLHLAVWTGSKMIVWAGVQHSYHNQSHSVNSGGIYDPASDSWTTMNTTNAPGGGSSLTAVWTGSEMIAWGGYTSVGGRYNPNTDTWTPTNAANAPSPRTDHTAVWTGSEMIVWGGISSSGSGSLNDGGRYNPANDTWRPTSTTGAPSPRYAHRAVWTGTEMIVWGGNDPLPTNTGGRYNPSTDSWTPTSTANAPPPKSGHVAVWTGELMIVWSVTDNKTGGRYNPANDSWTPTDNNDSPPPITFGVWTGAEMIIWYQGAGCQGTCPSLSKRYDPATYSWRPMSNVGAPGSPPGDRPIAAVWTGTEMIVWGVNIWTSGPGEGGRYNPQTDSWRPVTTNGAPVGRSYFTGVWTGSEMIIWGGQGNDGTLQNTGGRYNPSTDTWRPTNTNGAPQARYIHSAVWTGTEMIVWGGSASFPSHLNDGGRYNPANDSWTPTTTIGAPEGRRFHTAVWTGSEMIVWGGRIGDYNDTEGLFNTGGRYNPSSDTWTPTSMTSAPAPRFKHTAVWTGELMIVWGGIARDAAGYGSTNTGGRYQPRTDTWTPTSTLRAPGRRYEHIAFWTDTGMLVWGGYADDGSASHGGYYFAPGATTSNTPPAVRITAPLVNAQFDAGSTIQINAEASDNDGTVSSVNFYANDTLLGTDTQAPYTFTWGSVRSGNYAITASATDNSGSVTRSAPVQINVEALIGPPNAVVTSPADLSTFTAPATIRVAATVQPNPDYDVTKVEFWLSAGQGGKLTLIYTDTTAPYGFDLLNQPAGTYIIYAFAYDGNDVGLSSGARYTITGQNRTNVALASNGATTFASSIYSTGYPVSAINNGDRRGANWEAGGGWNDATAGQYPDWVEVRFGGARTLSEVDVFTVQDEYANPLEPTAEMTFTKYGVTHFEVQSWNGTNWLTIPGASVAGNGKVWNKLSFSPVTTDRIRVVVTGALAGYSRLTEVEAWQEGATPTPPPTPDPSRTNVALASMGATTQASSAYSAAYPVSAINNGDRRGAGWEAGGGWNDASLGQYPDWVEVSFAGSKTIDEIDVFTLQDEYANPLTPTAEMTFTQYGVTDFAVQYWDEAASVWREIPGARAAANRRVWCQFTFPAVTTAKVRMVISGALAGYSRLAEVEAWQTATTRPNHALASNGATVIASSVYSGAYPAAAINNGDRRGANWEAGGGWNDATAGQYPDWVEVRFSGARTLSEVDVFTVQDDYANPLEPTAEMTFTKYGVTHFEVQYWNGAGWTAIPGASVAANNKVWSKLTFSPLTTDRIRVVVTGALAGYSRLTEVEAYQ